MALNIETINTDTWRLGRREFLGATLAGCLATSSASAITPASSVNHRITIVLTGGASHLDLWDLKPAAPREIRGPFRPIATSIPGLHISEHLPLLARQAHLFTLFRGMTDDGPDIHDLGGYSSLIENSLELFPGPSSPKFSPNDHGSFDQWSFNRFSDSDRRRYGEHPFGRNALLALQLISQPATRQPQSDITIHFSAGILNTLSWDMHADGGDLAVNFQDLAWKLLPHLDQGLSALLTDLHETGLLQQTIVSVISEMGRTPRLNSRGGRDHYKRAWTNLVAGGPFLGGNIIGSTDPHGETVTSHPCHPHEFSQQIQSQLLSFPRN